MKASNWKSKHILPVVLIGLLSLNVSWESWLTLRGFSTADHASEAAERVCESPTNEVISALAKAKRNTQTSAIFSLEKANSDDGNYSGTVDGQNIYYKGQARVRALTPQYMTKQEMYDAGLLGQSNGGTPDLSGGTTGVTDYSNDTAGEMKNGQYVMEDDGNGGQRIKQVLRKYLVYNVSVSSTTDSEAATCDDCFKETIESTRSKQVWIQAYPNPGNLNRTACEQVFDDAVELFEEAKDDMIADVKKEIKEVLRIAEEEELRDERKRMIKQCLIKRSATLADVKEYEEEGEISDAHSYEDDLEGKLRCHRKNLVNLKGEERHNYFKEAHVQRNSSFISIF